MIPEEGKLLGKKVDYPKSYCPEILVAVPRSQNRETYGIFRAEELFCGWDCWHCYECSFLLDNGMPVIGILKIVYPSNSLYIVESKSLKLYLGSFNMLSLGQDKTTGISNYTRRIEEDLSQLLSVRVNVCFYSDFPSEMPFDFNEYRILEDSVQPDSISFSVYQEQPAWLEENISRSAGEIKVCSRLLKSNCKITGQPDWGTLYIWLKGQTLPDKQALLKYIISLRNENHFHEEICEMTYKRLSDLFQPEILMTSCLYTRRGGIDICPVRANKPEFLPQYLPQARFLTKRSFRQ